MIQVNLEDIKKDISTFIQNVECGEKLILISSGKPVAEVNPLSDESNKLRPYALCADEFEVPDDFDDPLPNDILASFEG